MFFAKPGLKGKLDELKIANNTIVVFLSDNGGADSITDNYPLRSGKGTGYEGGTREPMFVRWKGVTKAGDSCDVPVIGMDLYPTFVAMAGGQINPACGVLDGVDLTGVIKKKVTAIDRTLHWMRYPLKVHYGSVTGLPYGAMRKGNYKLIEKFAILDGKQAAGYELYNLEYDLSETTNLIDIEPTKFQELKADMEAWRTSVNAPVFDPHMYD